MKSNESPSKPRSLFNGSGKTRVIIADSHECVGGLVEIALLLEGVYQVVAHTGLGATALEKCRAVELGILILDPRLPDVSGGDLIRKVRHQCAGIRVMVFSGVSNPEVTLDVLNARPHGFVHKEESLAVFYDVLRAVVRGSRYFSEYAARLIDGHHQNGNSHKQVLAPREKDVLTLLARGRSSKQIAGELKLASKTVDHYRAALMSKLDIHDVAGLTRYAVSMGMVNAES